MLLVFLGSSALAEKFFLTSEKGGEKYGPFEFREGQRVVVGGKVFVISKRGAEIDRVVLKRKAESLILPVLELRQANIRDVVRFLRDESSKLDKTSPEDKRGVAIVLKTDGVPAGDLPLVTYSARNISLLHAIQILAQVTGLHYRIDGSAIYIEAVRPKLVSLHCLVECVSKADERRAAATAVEPVCEFYVNGDLTSSYPAGSQAILQLEPGKHHIRVVAEGYETWERTVTLVPGKDSQVVVRLQKQKPGIE